MKSGSRNGAGDPGDLKDPSAGQAWLLGGSDFQAERSPIRSQPHNHVTHSVHRFFLFSSLFLSGLVAGCTVEKDTFLHFALVTHKSWCYKEKRKDIKHVGKYIFIMGDCIQGYEETEGG